MATTMSSSSSSKKRKKVYAIFDNGSMRERQSYLLLPEDCTIGDAVHSFNRHHAKDLWNVQQVELIGIVASKDRLNREVDVVAWWAPTSVPLGEMMEPDDYLVLCSCDPPIPPVPPPAVADDPPDAAAVADDPPDAAVAANHHAETPPLGDDEKKAEAGRTSGPNGMKPHGGRTSNRVNASRIPKRNEVRRLHDELSPVLSQRQRERKKTSHFAPARWQSQMSTTTKGSNSKQIMVSRTDTNTTYYRRNHTPTTNETSLSLREVLTQAYMSPMSVYKFCNTNDIPRTTLYGHMHRSGIAEMTKPFDDEVAKKIDDYVESLNTTRRGRKPSNKWAVTCTGHIMEQHNSQSRVSTSSKLTFQGSRREDDERQGPLPKKARIQQTTAHGENIRRPAAAAAVQQLYQVGSRHFYQLNNGGVEYPVIIVQGRPGGPRGGCSKKLKSNERRIVLEDDPRTTRRVKTSQLLSVTPAREKAFQNAKKTMSGHLTREEREQTRQMEEEQRNKRQNAEQEATERARRRGRRGRRRKDQDRAKRHEKEEQKKFGERTHYWGPFPGGEKPGSLVVQDTRRVYVARDNETPCIIAKKFGVPVGKVVYDNCLNYSSLRENTRLKPLTLIVLPLENEPVQDHNDDANPGHDEKLNRDEVLSPHHVEPTEFLDNSIENQSVAVPANHDDDAIRGRDASLIVDQEFLSFLSDTESDDNIENQQDIVMPVNNDGYASLERGEERPICDDDFFSFPSDTDSDNSVVENQQDDVTEDGTKKDHLLSPPSSRVATAEFTVERTAVSRPQQQDSATSFPVSRMGGGSRRVPFLWANMASPIASPDLVESLSSGLRPHVQQDSVSTSNS